MDGGKGVQALDDAALDGVTGGTGWQPAGPDTAFAEGEVPPPSGIVPPPVGEDGEVSPEGFGKRIVF